MFDSPATEVFQVRSTERALAETACRSCARDLLFLKLKRRPRYETGTNSISVVDLFSGAGGFSLGLAEAFRRLGYGASVKLAIENDPAVAGVFKENFRGAQVSTEAVEEVFPGRVGARQTAQERRMASGLGAVEILVGGPPCQGHSDLNNRTRRDDPRNGLYSRMVRAAEVLRPLVVLIENVPGIVHDVEGIVGAAVQQLRALGFGVATKFFGMELLGVPQCRRRHVLLAIRRETIDPARVLASVVSLCALCHVRSVGWALDDILAAEGLTPFDTASGLSQMNAERIDWLFENHAFDLPNELRPKCHQSKHSYRSMYGRLRWDLPAQTITTGYGSMGQGRYVHPRRKRTLTPHEAARLQTFPDFFSFRSASSRSCWAKMIGNALPPLMGVALGERLLKVLRPEIVA